MFESFSLPQTPNRVQSLACSWQSPALFLLFLLAALVPPLQGGTEPPSADAEFFEKERAPPPGREVLAMPRQRWSSPRAACD